MSSFFGRIASIRTFYIAVENGREGIPFRPRGGSYVPPPQNGAPVVDSRPDSPSSQELVHDSVADVKGSVKVCPHPFARGMTGRTVHGPNPHAAARTIDLRARKYCSLLSRTTVRRKEFKHDAKEAVIIKTVEEGEKIIEVN